jgi:hypothetical protein
VKFYFDVREEVRAGEALAEAEARANAALSELAKAFTEVAMGGASGTSGLSGGEPRSP